MGLPLMAELLLLMPLLVLMLPIRNSVIKKELSSLLWKKLVPPKNFQLLVTNSVKLLALLPLLLIMLSLVLEVLLPPLLQLLLVLLVLVPVLFPVQFSPLDFHFWPFWLHSGSDLIHHKHIFSFIQDILEKK